jgi:WD40 repeat protein
MAKSSSAASTPLPGPDEQIPLEALAEIFRQPASSGRLSPAQTTEILLRGGLFTLEQDGSKPAIEILQDAARFCPNISIRSQAIATLGKLAIGANQEAREALYFLAIFDHNLAASQVIRQHDLKTSCNDLQSVYYLINERTPEYQHCDPDFHLLTGFFLDQATGELQDEILDACSRAGLVTWRLIATAAKTPSEPNLESIHRQFGSIPETERQLVLNILDRLAKSGSTLAKEEICQLFVDFDYPPARILAIQQGYAPAAPIQAALFYFLAEHWQIYEYLDFNQSLLAAAYESAGPDLRKKILYLSRYSGRTEWMSGLSTTSRQRWLWDMNDADWELAIRNLHSTQNYADLWRLAQVSSPIWSAKILRAMAPTGWLPASAEEREGFQRLLEIAGELNGENPPVARLHSWPSPSPDITCMAIDHDTSHLAVAGSNSTIHQWGIYKAPSPIPPLIGPVPQVRALAYSPDHDYITVANGDNILRVFRLADGKLVKSLEGHTALVRSLTYSPDGRVLFSASFDGSLRAWRFPEGPELNRIQPSKNEIFSLATSPDGQILLAAGADQLVRVYRWPDTGLLWELSGHTNTVTALVTVPRGQLAASAGRDGAILLWNYIAGRSIQRMPSDELITGLAFHPNEQFLFGATAQGNLLIWNISTGRKIESLTAHSHPITGLAVSPEGYQVYTASNDATLSIWDTQLFTWAYTPIGNNRSQTLTLVDQRLRHAAQKPAERSWLVWIGELIRWRQRFDVEVEETHAVISVGEFDIEL